MAQPDPPSLPRDESTRSQRRRPDLSDDLLEEIFLRVGSPADLVRASAACGSFRRIVTDPTFLRRFRSLHPPLLLGFLDAEREGFHPAVAPHPNAPAARALAGAASFHFDHLPGRGPCNRWCPRDVCQGHVLLQRGSFLFGKRLIMHLAVCDPLTRRYQLLPQIPEDLLASSVRSRDVLSIDTCLVPTDDEGAISFNVIHRIVCDTKLVIILFSSGSGQWNAGMSTTWDALPQEQMPDRPQYAYGCLYWKMHNMNKLIKLDITRMEFSTADLPPDHDMRHLSIFEVGEGRLGMFSMILGVAYVNYYKVVQNQDNRTSEWQLQCMIPLPHDYKCYCIKGMSAGCILLIGTQNVGAEVNAACFSLGIKTLKIERVNEIRFPFFDIYPYSGYPPFMSSEKI